MFSIVLMARSEHAILRIRSLLFLGTKRRERLRSNARAVGRELSDQGRGSAAAPRRPAVAWPFTSVLSRAVWSCRRRTWRAARARAARARGGARARSRPPSRWRSCSARAARWARSARCRRWAGCPSCWPAPRPCRPPACTATSPSAAPTTTRPPRPPRSATNTAPTSSYRSPHRQLLDSIGSADDDPARPPTLTCPKATEYIAPDDLATDGSPGRTPARFHSERRFLPRHRGSLLALPKISILLRFCSFRSRDDFVRSNGFVRLRRLGNRLEV